MHDKVLKYSSGIDVSGNDLRVCFSQIGTDQRVKVKGSRKFTNTLNGFKAFDVWLKKYRKDPSVPLRVTLEATGIYHEKLAYYLHRIRVK